MSSLLDDGGQRYTEEETSRQGRTKRNGDVSLQQRLFREDIVGFTVQQKRRRVFLNQGVLGHEVHDLELICR